MFGFFKGTAMDDGMEDFRSTPNALLIDVREPAEYARGHVEGALNMPTDQLAASLGRLDRTRPLFVYCASGGRASMACKLLRAQGFDCTSIGGVRDYSGELVK